MIINKDTGEVNRMRDDGIHYYQDLLIIPPDKVEEFCAELNMVMSQQQENEQEPDDAGNYSLLGRQAP